MSNIYIQEPPTNGKVLLKTSVGDIDIELWSKECPKTCRNFIQMVLDGFYNNSLFHRLVKGFIVQCGETDKEVPELVEPIKNEVHSRLRFMRRGLAAMANKDPEEINMQFFFTLGATPELQNTHTIFGKITGETIYNMLKLEDSQTDPNDRPLYPHKILKATILNNPFPDLQCRVVKEDMKVKEGKKRKEGVKNFALLSFGDEAEDDEAEVVKARKQREEIPSSSKSEPIPTKTSTQSAKDIVRDKMSKKSDKKDMKKDKKRLTSESPPDSPIKKIVDDVGVESDESYEFNLDREKQEMVEKKRKEIQNQIKDVKKQYHSEKRGKAEVLAEEIKPKEPKDEAVQAYLDEKEKYVKKKMPKSTTSARELQTLKLLEKFKNRLSSAKEDTEGAPPKPAEDGELNDDADTNWLSHKLDFSETVQEIPKMARDASTKGDDWFDMFDPRNPLNKRKRNENDGRDDRSKRYSRPTNSSRR